MKKLFTTIVPFVLAQIFTYYVFFEWQTKNLSCSSMIVVSCSAYFIGKMVCYSLAYFFEENLKKVLTNK